MFGDLLNIVIFVAVVFLGFKMFVKGIVPGVIDGLGFLIKIICSIIFLPFAASLGFLKAITGGTNDEPIGIERETITITNSFKDRKGRTVRVNKTINVGARSVTKRDLDRIR